MAWFNRKAQDQTNTPVQEPEDDDDSGSSPNSGPLPGAKKGLPKFSFNIPLPSLNFTRKGRAAKQSREAGAQTPEKELTHFERQRALVDSFQEDQLAFLDRAKLWAAKAASIILPIIAVWAIGGELGQYFAGNVAFTWSNQWIVSQYVIGYAGEFALAVLTYVLGHAFNMKADGPGHAVKLTITAIVWLLFLAASAAGQWYVALATLHPDAQMQQAVAIRVGMACSLDIASVCLMWWRGKSLAKFLADQQKRTESIRAVNESELTMEAAQDAAARRRKEDEAYQAAKDQHNQMIVKIQELQTAALVRQAEQALIGQPGGSRNRDNW